MDYRKHLTEDILPFWLNNAIDEELGGIFTRLDQTGKLYGTEKSVWFQGRSLYIFSLAHNCGVNDPRLLPAAKKIFDFLPKCTDENFRMAYVVSREGQLIEKRSFWFSETFAAIGCCEYWLASGEETAKVWAEKYFDVAYRLYCEEKKHLTAIHPLSGCMILLSTAQVMRKIDPKKYDPIASEMTRDILLHLTDKGLLENVAPDGAFVDTPTGRTVNPGHSLEAAWFLMVQGELTDDPSLLEKAEKIIDISMGYGLADGGILTFRDCDGRPMDAIEWDMKKWWPQCEAMLATKMCYLKTKKQKYLDWYKEIERYVESHFIDRENGEWYGYLHYDGTIANTLKGNITKGPFHIPRMLLLLEKMDTLAQQGKKLTLL